MNKMNKSKAQAKRRDAANVTARMYEYEGVRDGRSKGRARLIIEFPRRGEKSA